MYHTDIFINNRENNVPVRRGSGSLRECCILSLQFFCKPNALKVKCIKRNKITNCFILNHIFLTICHLLFTVGFEEYNYLTHCKQN